MDFRAPAIGGGNPLPAPAHDRVRLPALSRPPIAPAVTVDAGPPPELREEIAAAARVVERLRREGRELRFEPDPDTGRIAVEVRDLDGNVIRRIPLIEALEVAGGAPLD